MASMSFPVQRPSRLLALVLGGPLALAALVLLLAGALPLRFDLRTFQMQARLNGLGLPRGADFLVLTADNEIESAELSAFALSHWSFPRGTRHWVTLQERSHGVWAGGFRGVDAQGRFHEPVVTHEGWGWKPAEVPAWVSEVAERGALVYDSAATRQAFEARVPSLAGAKRVFVLSGDQARRVPVSRPRLGLGSSSWWRLATVFGVMLVGGVLALRHTSAAALALLAACAGGAAAFALWLGSVYALGQAWPGAWGPMGILLWLTGAVLVSRPGPPIAFRLPRGRVLAAVATALVAYTAVATLRLDFDGDCYTTYLQVARYYYWAGQHLPQDPGVAGLVQGGVYPPAFAVLLSVPLWVTDQPRDASLALGPATSLAVVLYRWAIVALNLGVFMALYAYLRALPGGSAAAGLGGVVALLLTMPTFRGQHVAAETLLLPWLAMALIASLAGRRFDRPLLAWAGLLVGGLLTLVKLDGLPFLVLLVLPAALAVRTGWSWRREGLVATGLALGLVPYVVWRASGPLANPAFGQLAPAQVPGQLAGLVVQAFKLVVKHELWLPLLVALPVAVLWRRREGLRAFLPAAGVLAMSAMWICVYAISTQGTLKHMETSLPRIMLGPALAATLYALEALCLTPRAEEG